MRIVMLLALLGIVGCGRPARDVGHWTTSKPCPKDEYCVICEISGISEPRIGMKVLCNTGRDAGTVFDINPLNHREVALQPFRKDVE